ncbi:glycosyltransferase family 2 protein [Arthrobacter sp. RCC_34]|uniref:glycosyltransferase family 2 protein n=1 Tax=Arthrobacter sp. RCC_34 TaxID=3239230 RepID=UPI00352645EE
MIDVEVVVPVHTVDRPLERAVQSAFAGNDDVSVRVTIVCHNITRDTLTASVPGLVGREDVRFLELEDGTASPAGPKNLGLRAATGRYLTVLDSDDFFAPGSLAAWSKVLDETDAGLLAAPLQDEHGNRILTPRSRWGRTSALDPARDGLAYASAPRGLWRADVWESAGASYTEGLGTGEDLEIGLRLWFSDARIEYPRSGVYHLTSGGPDRVSARRWTLQEELEPILRLDQNWLQSLGVRQRSAIAAKLWRINVFAAFLRHADDPARGGTDTEVLSAACAVVRELAPEVPLSIAEQAFADGISSSASQPERWPVVADAYRRSGRLSRILPAVWRCGLRAEGPLRGFLRSYLPVR